MLFLMSPNPRPTPEQILSAWAEAPFSASDLVANLAEHGYVIVHPDDVPVRPAHLGTPDGYPAVTTAEFKGWNACRAHIFGDDQ